MIRVITIAREYGSGGAEVGRRLAATLRWRFIDRDLIARAASLGRVTTGAAEMFDERVESWLERIMAGFKAASEIYVAPWSTEVFDANSMHAITEHVILAAAQAGDCVIIGRGSQCILRERDDALHVFVYAPIKARLERLQKRFPKEQHLQELMARIDRDRASYLHQHYGCDWQDRHLYDLCINTAIGVGSAVAVIEQAAKVVHAETPYVM